MSLQGYTADLHIHSGPVPLRRTEMDPGGFCPCPGLVWMFAITDHNISQPTLLLHGCPGPGWCRGNCRPEEIHLVCLLASPEVAMDFGDELRKHFAGSA